MHFVHSPIRSAYINYMVNYYMTVISTKKVKIYFGDATDIIQPAPYAHTDHGSSSHILTLAPYNKLTTYLPLQNLLFLQQTHSTTGYTIKQDAPLPSPFSLIGDFLITDKPHCGIGVLAADCMPIAYYDGAHNIIALAHAGWRGSVNNIAQKTLQQMMRDCGTRPQDCTVWLGPSAQSCCYQVGPEWVDSMPEHIEEYVTKRDNSWYFDMPKLICAQLLAGGITPQAIQLDCHACTMCNNSMYHSHRSHKERAGRQMTVMCLE